MEKCMLQKIIFFLLFCFLSINAFADPVITDTTSIPQTNQKDVYSEIHNMHQFDNCDSKQPTNDNLTQVLNANGCCKICYKGKACGNSCISKNYTCHKPPGCACDG